MVICPVCKNPQPFFRFPTNIKQFCFGGWTCQYCKSELNWKGKIKKENKEGLKEYEENLKNKLYKEEYIKEKARLQAQKEHNKK